MTLNAYARNSISASTLAIALFTLRHVMHLMRLDRDAVDGVCALEPSVGTQDHLVSSAKAQGRLPFRPHTFEVAPMGSRFRV